METNLWPPKHAQSLIWIGGDGEHWKARPYTNQRSELLKGGLHFWGKPLCGSAWTAILKDWRKLELRLDSWDFPERTQVNESSQTQTGLCSSVHFSFIQVILQSSEFEGNLSKSNTISGNAILSCPAIELVFGIPFRFDSFSISFLAARLLGEDDSTLIYSWAWGAMKSHCL